MLCTSCNVEMGTGLLSNVPIWHCPECKKMIGRSSGETIRLTPSTPLPRSPAASPVNVGALGGISNGEPDSPRRSEGEQTFAALWNRAHPELPFVVEYAFHGLREWRLDFAWPEKKVCVEYEGGGAFGHGRKNRYDADLYKYNALSFKGWRLFRLTKEMLEEKGEHFIDYIWKALQEDSL